MTLRQPGTYRNPFWHGSFPDPFLTAECSAAFSGISLTDHFRDEFLNDQHTPVLLGWRQGAGDEGSTSTLLDWHLQNGTLKQTSAMYGEHTIVKGDLKKYGKENIDVLLVGDIGGTKTELAVFSSVTALSMPLAHATFPSARYASLAEIVQEFLTQFNVQIDRACLGVAGPVVAGQATITNLPWVIVAAQLQDEFKLRSVTLMNDLEAMANAVPFLQRRDLHPLNVGQPAINSPLAVIAPGTGLGEAFLTWNGKLYSTNMSEGGHTDFAPTNETQDALLCYLRPHLNHVSYEWVCSGMGLPNIYAYFKESGYAQEPAWLAEQLVGAQDPNPIIAKAALDNASELCVATLDTFVSILGAEAGNLALKVLATGGVYVGGGIPRRILPFLDKGLFMQAFLHKGRLSDILTHIPVYVILNPNVGLLGAAYYGFATERHEDQ